MMRKILASNFGAGAIAVLFEGDTRPHMLLTPDEARALRDELSRVLGDGPKEQCNCAAIHNVACIFWSKP